MSSILNPLYDVVSWIMLVFYKLFRPVFGSTSGVTWTLSIVGLVIVIRILLIPLFVKQIKSQRGLQMLQPQIKALQEKHKNNKEKQSQELMKLYKETGTNPLASCLPILVQAPIFYALFHTLREIANDKATGVLSLAQAQSASEAHFFGAQLSETFTTTTNSTTRVVTIVMIVAMSASQFLTQRQLMVKNVSAAAAAANPMASQQKILLYVFPLMFAVFGINFPVGVLIYWLTTNLWSMGQQFYVIRNMPSPGTPAEAAYQLRQAARAAKGKRLRLSAGRAPVEPEPVPEAAPAPRGQRQQPVRKDRQRGGAQRPGGARPAQSAARSGDSTAASPDATASGTPAGPDSAQQASTSIQRDAAQAKPGRRRAVRRVDPSAGGPRPGVTPRPSSAPDQG